MNYYGITIIPDNQIEKLTKIFQNNIDYNNKETVEKLISSITNKNSDEILVHFGIWIIVNDTITTKAILVNILK